MPPTLCAYIWQNSRRGQIVLCVLPSSFLTAVPARSLALLLWLAAARS